MAEKQCYRKRELFQDAPSKANRRLAFGRNKSKHAFATLFIFDERENPGIYVALFIYFQFTAVRFPIRATFELNLAVRREACPLHQRQFKLRHQSYDADFTAV